MQAIRSILVVIEPDQLEGLALKRAQLIAGVTQSHLHLLVCEAPRPQRRSQRPGPGAARGRLQRLDQPGLEGLLHQTIIAEQQAEGCGLIIKQHFPDNPLKRPSSPRTTGSCCASRPVRY